MSEYLIFNGKKMLANEVIRKYKPTFIQFWILYKQPHWKLSKAATILNF